MIASVLLSRAWRTTAAVLAAILLALAAVWASAAPASAHDELVSSTPAAGTSVDVLPAQLVLTFSAELLSDGSSTVVQVTDGSGASVTDAAPVVEGSTVTQSLAGTATGPISVLWRVVSSDGHPISGEFVFDVAAAPVTPTASPTPSAEPEPVATEVASPSPTVPVAPTDSAGAGPLPWVLGGLGLLVVIGLVVWLLAARARQQQEVARERIAGRDVPGER